jgi:hypothetical protein
MYQTTRSSGPAAAMKFVPAEIVDPSFGNLRVARLSIPQGWRLNSWVRWDFTSGNYPVRMHVRAQSPDGKLWIELLPMDAIYWMDGMYMPMRVGDRAFGAVYAPRSSIEHAMQYLVVLPARAHLPNFQIMSKREVDPLRLTRAFRLPDARGEAMAMRARYLVNGVPAEEDFYAFYTAPLTVSYAGPWGATREHHRQLVLCHSVGATDGLLPSAYPLLSRIAASFQMDEAFMQHVRSVQTYITNQFNWALQQGYDQIAAAAQLSYTISANNDALIASMDQQRSAQHHADALRRETVTNLSDASQDGFDQMIRGTQRMEDPYWGTSEQSNQYDYHWTDSQGNYRASDDPGFDPNIGAGSGASWQRMQASR